MHRQTIMLAMFRFNFCQLIFFGHVSVQTVEQLCHCLSSLAKCCRLCSALGISSVQSLRSGNRLASYYNFMALLKEKVQYFFCICVLKSCPADFTRNAHAAQHTDVTLDSMLTCSCHSIVSYFCGCPSAADDLQKRYNPT